MRDVKKFIKNIILFIPFTVLMYIIFILFLGEVLPQFLKPNVNYRIGSYGHMYSRIKEIKKFKNVDLLFLGSSHSYRGFDTRIFEKYGCKTFNLGSSGQTPIQTEVLLDRYLDSLNPKIVIFEVSPMIFSSDGVESSLDLIANDKNDLLTVTKLIKWNNIKTINTAIIGFWRDYMRLDNDFVEENKKDNDYYVSGGFVEKTLNFYKPEPINKHEINIEDAQLETFKNCINKIKKRKIKLLLVQAPISKNLYNSYTNPQYFDDLISKYGNYYNFNKLLNIQDTIHFSDSHHLNQLGVEFFNKEAVKLLNLENCRTKTK